MKALLRIDRLPAWDADLARTWLYAHRLVALIGEHHIAQCDAFPPEPPAKSQPSLWRRCLMAFTTVMHAVMRRISIGCPADLLSRTRQINEAPRARALQMLPNAVS